MTFLANMWCVCVCVLCLCVVCVVWCSRFGCSPRPLLPTTPSAGPPKISRFFFPSPATIFILSSLSWGSSCGILVVFLKRRGPEMCTFGVLGLSCETPAAPPDNSPADSFSSFYWIDGHPCMVLRLCVIVELFHSQVRNMFPPHFFAWPSMS